VPWSTARESWASTTKRRWSSQATWCCCFLLEMMVSFWSWKTHKKLWCHNYHKCAPAGQNMYAIVHVLPCGRAKWRQIVNVEDLWCQRDNLWCQTVICVICDVMSAVLTSREETTSKE
jgi:hypothetical protein